MTNIDLDAIRAHVESRAAYRKVFPPFYEELARSALASLQPAFPGAQAFLGPLEIKESAAVLPELGLDVPTDWVSFSFEGVPMYDAHVGVIFLCDDWPITYHVGLHLLGGVYAQVRPHLDIQEMTARVGLRPQEVFAEHVHEHRWIDPPQEMDLHHLDVQREALIGRIMPYYAFGASLLHRVKEGGR